MKTKAKPELAQAINRQDAEKHPANTTFKKFTQ